MKPKLQIQKRRPCYGQKNPSQTDTSAAEYRYVTAYNLSVTSTCHAAPSVKYSASLMSRTSPMPMWKRNLTQNLLTLYEEAAVSKTGISKLLTKWSNYDLLILDEFLLNDLTQPEQLFLFELIERRYDKASMIFCTQYRMEDWHTRLGGGVHADAILDRIIHNVEIVFAGKLNMRKIESVKG